MRSSILFAICAASCLWTIGCSPAKAPLASATTREQPEHARPSSPPPDALAGLTCESARVGWARSCTWPGYKITGSVSDCGRDTASLGSATARVPLMDRFPPSSERGATTATVSKGQMLCIHYVAEPLHGGTRFLYATAIAASMVKGCEGRCTAPNSAVDWAGRSPEEPCRHADRGYSPGCASGWIDAGFVDTYDMGLDAGNAPPADMFEKALPDTTIYGTSASDESTCVAGANLDDLGAQSAVVARFDRGAASPTWVTPIPHDPGFYQSRATHCACVSGRCYVLVATDTQPPQSLSQTMLSVVRVSTAGAIVAMREVGMPDSTPANASAWVDSGATHFELKGERIAIRGAWRATPDDAAHEFSVEIPTF